MNNGDRLFGPNGASGTVTGTAAALVVTLDFSPQWVEVMNTTNGNVIKWYKNMPADSGVVFTGGSGSTLTYVNGESPTVVGSTSAGLAHAPAFINAVNATAGGVTGPLGQVPNTLSPTTGTYSVNYTIGLISLLPADTITALSVSYAYTSGGGSGGGTYVSSGGITSGSNGFTIGTNININILDNNLVWNAGR